MMSNGFYYHRGAGPFDEYFIGSAKRLVDGIIDLDFPPQRFLSLLGDYVVWKDCIGLTRECIKKYLEAHSLDPSILDNHFPRFKIKLVANDEVRIVDFWYRLADGEEYTTD